MHCAAYVTMHCEIIAVMLLQQINMVYWVIFSVLLHEVHSAGWPLNGNGTWSFHTDGGIHKQYNCNSE
jgi:hypothetical protein